MKAVCDISASQYVSSAVDTDAFPHMSEIKFSDIDEEGVCRTEFQAHKYIIKRGLIQETSCAQS